MEKRLFYFNVMACVFWLSLLPPAYNIHSVLVIPNHLQIMMKIAKNSCSFLKQYPNDTETPLPQFHIT